MEAGNLAASASVVTAILSLLVACVSAYVAYSTAEDSKALQRMIHNNSLKGQKQQTIINHFNVLITNVARLSAYLDTPAMDNKDKLPQIFIELERDSKTLSSLMSGHQLIAWYRDPGHQGQTFSRFNMVVCNAHYNPTAGGEIRFSETTDTVFLQAKLDELHKIYHSFLEKQCYI
ncbi:hypothetical protein [Endozoicomonas atrinae]|uniref:hypothetical protein n=1 Tax=Endozoicomonas atrinae TaxID=1333660 RepID=UPI0008248875|nr:hypothetical protein [Endozoicomonas atrinae]